MFRKTPMPRAAALAGALLLSGLVAGCGSSTADASASESGESSESEDTSEGASAEESESATPRPAPTASQTVAVGGRIEGEGDTLVTVDNPEGATVVVEVFYSGFNEITLNDVGGDPFVGPIGPTMSGFKVLLEVGQERDAFEVVTPDKWSLNITPLVEVSELMAVWNGTGPNVYRFNGGGLDRTLAYTCDSPHSSLWTASGGAGGWDEIFSGDARETQDVPISGEALVLVIYCDGNWATTDMTPLS